MIWLSVDTFIRKCGNLLNHKWIMNKLEHFYSQIILRILWIFREDNVEASRSNLRPPYLSLTITESNEKENDNSLDISWNWVPNVHLPLCLVQGGIMSFKFLYLTNQHPNHMFSTLLPSECECEDHSKNVHFSLEEMYCIMKWHTQ